MNLQPFFEMQDVLDERIVKEKGLEGQDLLPEKILALQVELGELANEWRGFKFWSEDREPRTYESFPCNMCVGSGDENWEVSQERVWEKKDPLDYKECVGCKGSGDSWSRNPLLEEYVDCLHFILSIGNDLGTDKESFMAHKEYKKIAESLGINKLLIGLMSSSVELINGSRNESEIKFLYADIIIGFRVLGKLLGFTPEQIEKAYYDKNKVNHERQQNGY